MIPATVLADLLRTLIEDLAFDTTSADVRCSVFKVSAQNIFCCVELSTTTNELSFQAVCFIHDTASAL